MHYIYRHGALVTLGPGLGWPDVLFPAQELSGVRARVEMVTEIPLYIQCKIWLVSLARLTADSLHIYGGIFCLLGTLYVFRGRKLSFWMLLPGLLVSLGVEVGDLYYDWKHALGMRWDHSFHDIVNTNLLPFIIFCFLKSSWRGSDLPAPSSSRDESRTETAAPLAD